MNKKQQRELENKLREATLEADDLTPERINRIREKAHAAYLQTNTDTTRPKIKAKTGSGLLRRVAAVFAIAVGLIVMSVVYTALAPVSTGNANNLVRRAAIWINDQLHLGISFPVPEEGMIEVKDMVVNSFSSIQEAAAFTDCPIFFFANTNQERLTSIELINPPDFSLLVYYASGEKKINIYAEQLSNEVFDFSADNVQKLASPVGEVIIWQSGTTYRGTAFYDDYIIQIYGTIDKENFIRCCQSLSVVN